MLFEGPDAKSNQSNIVNTSITLFILFLIGISTFAFILETMTELDPFINRTLWIVIEYVCSISFTFEFVFRLFAWTVFKDRTYKDFVLNIFNWIDFTAIMPF